MLKYLPSKVIYALHSSAISFDLYFTLSSRDFIFWSTCLIDSRIDRSFASLSCMSIYNSIFLLSDASFSSARRISNSNFFAYASYSAACFNSFAFYKASNSLFYYSTLIFSFSFSATYRTCSKAKALFLSYSSLNSRFLSSKILTSY